MLELRAIGRLIARDYRRTGSSGHGGVHGGEPESTHIADKTLFSQGRSAAAKVARLLKSGRGRQLKWVLHGAGDRSGCGAHPHGVAQTGLGHREYINT